MSGERGDLPDDHDGYMPIPSADGFRVYFLRRGSLRYVHALWSIGLEGEDPRFIGEIGPFRGDLDLFYDVSSRGSIVWGPYREGRRELWSAALD